ncbi:helix-turn-helix domain-containing protein [Aquibacillus sp. 3ASR75-286]|nr:helix-turn-helix transcriptional regulator [Terrihalobacillus insolitus]MDC3414251.1 helix-turn-helix domain-containing protein [Terrihalobacillus insolitus]
MIKLKLKIGALIEESGLKKRYVAKELGVNENTLTNWTKNRSMPKLDQAVELADILNCKVEDLYENTPASK